MIEDISKINYAKNTYNISPMEDSNMTNYSILYKDQDEKNDKVYDVEGIHDKQYYLSSNSDNQVEETKIQLPVNTVEKFQSEDEQISFSNILLIFIIIVLIIIIVNYFFKNCMNSSNNKNYNFMNSSSTSSSSELIFY
jgi:ATP-dependent Zn protease